MTNKVTIHDLLFRMDALYVADAKLFHHMGTKLKR